MKGIGGLWGAGELLSLDLSLQRFNCHSVTWHQEGKVGKMMATNNIHGYFLGWHLLLIEDRAAS